MTSDINYCQDVCLRVMNAEMIQSVFLKFDKN